MGDPAARRLLGFWTGVGLVIANMVGVGVLTSTGYMAHDLGPGAILAAWAVGGVAAMAGARAYAALAAAIPRSGGEYRYLSELMHPAVGYLAGWTSLLVGFSAPIALAAATAGPFATTLFPRVPSLLVAAAMIAVATAAHSLDLRLSKGAQDALALMKVLLLVGFAAAGVALGRHEAPRWDPSPAFHVEPFMVSLVYIAFAYSGWNTTIYAAEEFRDPARTVPRAMLFGTGLVTLLYLVVNASFVANLSRGELAGWTAGDTSRITIGHLLIVKLLGPAAGRLMSALVLLALFSSVSSMTMVGPRVYAAMAREGYLPRVFLGAPGRPPLGSVLLQSGLALALLFTHSFKQLMHNIGSILTLTSALTVLTLFRLRPGWFPLACAVVFVALAGWMLWFAFRDSPWTLAWVGATAAIALAAWLLTRGRARSA